MVSRYVTAWKVGIGSLLMDKQSANKHGWLIQKVSKSNHTGGRGTVLASTLGPHKCQALEHMSTEFLKLIQGKKYKVNK